MRIKTINGNNLYNKRTFDSINFVFSHILPSIYKTTMNFDIYSLIKTK